MVFCFWLIPVSIFSSWFAMRGFYNLGLRPILSSLLPVLRGKRPLLQCFVCGTAVSFSPPEVLSLGSTSVILLLLSMSAVSVPLVLHYSLLCVICTLPFYSSCLFYCIVFSFSLVAIVTKISICKQPALNEHKLDFICIQNLKSISSPPLWSYCNKIYIFIHYQSPTHILATDLHKGT